MAGPRAVMAGSSRSYERARPPPMTTASGSHSRWSRTTRSAISRAAHAKRLARARHRLGPRRPGPRRRDGRSAARGLVLAHQSRRPGTRRARCRRAAAGPWLAADRPARDAAEPLAGAGDRRTANRHPDADPPADLQDQQRRRAWERARVAAFGHRRQVIVLRDRDLAAELCGEGLAHRQAVPALVQWRSVQDAVGVHGGRDANARPASGRRHPRDRPPGGPAWRTGRPARPPAGCPGGRN